MTYQDKAEEYAKKHTYYQLGMRHVDAFDFAKHLDSEAEEKPVANHMVPCGVSSCQLCDYAKSIEEKPQEHKEGCCEKCVGTCEIPHCECHKPQQDENTTFNGYGNTSGGTATMLPTGKPQQEDKTCTVCGEPITKDMRAMPSAGGSFTGTTHWKHYPPCQPKPQQECSEVCGAECTNMLHHPPAKVEAVEELRIQTHGKPGSLEDGLARIISKLNELVRVVNKMRQ